MGSRTGDGLPGMPAAVILALIVQEQKENKVHRKKSYPLLDYNMILWKNDMKAEKPD